MSRTRDSVSLDVDSRGQLALSNQRLRCDERSPMFPFNCPVVPPIAQQSPLGVPSLLPAGSGQVSLPALMPPVTPTPMTTVIVTVTKDPYPAYLVPILASIIVVIALANNPLYSWLFNRRSATSERPTASQPVLSAMGSVSSQQPVETGDMTPLPPETIPATPSTQPRLGGALVIHQDKVLSFQRTCLFVVTGSFVCIGTGAWVRLPRHHSLLWDVWRASRCCKVYAETVS